MTCGNVRRNGIHHAIELTSTEGFHGDCANEPREGGLSGEEKSLRVRCFSRRWEDIKVPESRS